MEKNQKSNHASNLDAKTDKSIEQNVLGCRMNTEVLMNKDVFQFSAIISPNMTDSQKRRGQIYCAL